MAYALGFNKEVTDIIYSMRDFRWEMVKNGGKAPTAQCIKPGYGRLPVHAIGLPEYGMEPDDDSDDSSYSE